MRLLERSQSELRNRNHRFGLVTALPLDQVACLSRSNAPHLRGSGRRVVANASLHQQRPSQAQVPELRATWGPATAAVCPQPPPFLAP